MTLLNTVLKTLARTSRKDKLIKWIKTGKEEVKLFLFADDMIFYTEGPKISARRLSELINSGHKFNTQRSITFMYGSNELTEKEMRKTMLFMATSKNIKKLQSNLTKEVKDL